MKKFCYGLVAGIVLTVISGAIFLWPKSRGEPEPVVTLNPTQEQVKKADVVKTVSHDFTINQPGKMPTKVKQSIPVAVSIKDNKTGQTQEAETVAEVEKTEAGDLNVKLDDVIAVDVPEPLKLKNEIGMFYDGDKWAYYKRDLLPLSLPTFKAAPWVGAAYNLDEQEFRVGVGLAVRF